MPEHRPVSQQRPRVLQPIVGLTAVTQEYHDHLANAEALHTLTSIWRVAEEFDGWFVGDYLLMPDHVHLFARASVDAKPLAKWIETWQSLSARRLKSLLGIKSFCWRRDFSDRFLLDRDSYGVEWDYVAMNPVRHGLCASPEDWPWKGRLYDLRC